MGRIQRLKMQRALLTDSIAVRVRFGESDAVGIAWHGSYVAYFEDGREHFGLRYAGISYPDYFRERTMAPVVQLLVDYISPLRPGDQCTLETRYVESPGAQLTFQYELRRDADQVVCARGQTTQLFSTPEGELLLTEPEFYAQWKKRWLPVE